MAGKGALDPRGVDTASRLSLQISVAANMVGVGVGVVDGGQLPAVGVQMLADLAARVLIAAAVDETDLRALQPHQSDLRRALDIAAFI